MKAHRPIEQEEQRFEKVVKWDKYFIGALIISVTSSYLFLSLYYFPDYFRQFLLCLFGIVAVLTFLYVIVNFLDAESMGEIRKVYWRKI